MTKKSCEVRYCVRCGIEMTDLDMHPNAKICDRCRKYGLGRHQPISEKLRLCKRCGNEICDLAEYPNAHVCKSCRVHWGNPNNHTTKKYGDAVRKYVDNIGWPDFITPSAIVKENPEILGKNVVTKTGKIMKKSGKVKVVAVCLANIVNSEGQKYVRYTDGCLHLEKGGDIDENAI